MQGKDANDAWVKMLGDVMEEGKECRPRGMRIKELIGYQSVVDMARPIVSVEARKLSRKFLAGEAYWILSGDNRVSTIAPYNSAIAKFSDDGTYFNGAYGPRVVDQLSYILDNLTSDHDSRQAVMTIWRANPRPSKDVPCTVAVQWFLRKRVDSADNEYDVIHCVDTMRSSDAWLGWPYDVFNFSMLTAYVALLYRERTGKSLILGNLHMNCGSQHVYETNWEGVVNLLRFRMMKKLESFDHNEFEKPQDLLDHIAAVRDEDAHRMKTAFMKELMP